MAINVKEVVKEFGIAAFVATVLDMFKDGIKEKGKEAINAGMKLATKKLTEEYRGELLAFILKDVAEYFEEGKTAAENFMKRQAIRQTEGEKSYSTTMPKERYQPGDEDKMVGLLTKLFKALDGTSEKTPEAAEKELQLRLTTFVALGNMSDEQFDTTLEFLSHDVLVQWLKKAKIWIVDVNKEVNNLLSPTAIKLQDWAQKLQRKGGYL